MSSKGRSSPTPSGVPKEEETSKTERECTSPRLRQREEPAKSLCTSTPSRAPARDRQRQAMLRLSLESTGGLRPTAAHGLDPVTLPTSRWVTWVPAAPAPVAPVAIEESWMAGAALRFPARVVPGRLHPRLSSMSCRVPKGRGIAARLRKLHGPLTLPQFGQPRLSSAKGLVPADDPRSG